MCAVDFLWLIDKEFIAKGGSPWSSGLRTGSATSMSVVRILPILLLFCDRENVRKAVDHENVREAATCCCCCREKEIR